VALLAAAAVYAGLGVVFGLWAVRDLSRGYAMVRRALHSRLPSALAGAESAVLD
jgi:hypothetical protein